MTYPVKHMPGFKLVFDCVRSTACRAILKIVVASVAMFLAAATFQLPVSAQTAAPTAGSETAAPPADRAETDAALRRRVAEMLTVFPEFRDIDVEATAGIVELTGTVKEDAHRQRAAEIARKIPTVTDIRNSIGVKPDTWYQTVVIYDRLSERLAELVVFIPLLGIAVLVFFAFVGISRILLRRSKLIPRITVNLFQQQILTQTTHILIVVIGLILALEILDATSLIGAVLGAAGATGIVLGFALKETIENYVAGLLLSLRQPFAPYDHIIVKEFEGHVVRLTSRATVLMTLEGNHVRIPNADVLKTPLVNYTRNPERRFDFEIGIGVDVDLIEARALAIEILTDMEGVLDTPEPDAWIEALGDSNVVMMVTGWVDQREFSQIKVRGEAIRRVKSAFEAADFDLPEPIYRLKLMKQGGQATATTTQASPKPARNDRDDAKVDIARDRHLEREVERERSAMPQDDLLSPQAKQE